jgi:dTDP-4-amino-4,6-dideoxygalactose transaminase
MEGGAIVTNDKELGQKLRLMQNFGFQGYDNVIYIGTNGKMTEVSAAMGLTNLESIETFIAQNRANYRAYRGRLAQIPGMSMLSFDESDELNYQYVVVEVDESVTGLSRDNLVEVLHSENVIARRYFYPGVHRMEPYRSTYADAIAPLPVTERVCKRVLVLPTGTAVSVADVDAVCDLIAVAISEAAAVRAKVGADRAIA